MSERAIQHEGEIIGWIDYIGPNPEPGASDTYRAMRRNGRRCWGSWEACHAWLMTEHARELVDEHERA